MQEDEEADQRERSKRGGEQPVELVVDAEDGNVPWIGGRMRRGVGPKVMRTLSCRISDRPKVATIDSAATLRMGWITTRWISAPSMKPISGATMKREPEIAGRLQRGPGQHGADHEEVAVREIDDVEQAEDDGEAKRDERDDQAPDQAVHRKQQQLIHLALMIRRFGLALT